MSRGLGDVYKRQFLSSSLVKEVAKFGGEINHMVPPSVEVDLKEYFK